MKWRISCMVVCLLAAWFYSPIAAGHGGQFVPPTDVVPPNLRGPSSGTGPSSPSGPSTPGPASPTVAGPRGPATSSGPNGSLGPRGGTTGSRKKINRVDHGLERWEFWWDCNKDAFLHLKDRLGQIGNISGTGSILIGRGRLERATPAHRPTPDLIKQKIVPALLNALGEDHPDLLDSAVLALARSLRAEEARPVLPQMVRLLKSRYRTAQESATLSLGVVDSPHAVQELHDLMSNNSRGQKWVGKHEVPTRVRCFAALSLGMLNLPDTVDRLFSVVNRATHQDRDLKTCAVLALGLMRDNDRQDEIVRFLMNGLNDRKLDEVIQAAYPIALGKLGDPISLSALVKAFQVKRQKNLVLQSCAIGIGLLAGMQDKEVIDLLRRYIRDGKNEQTRHFCFIALGQIGARNNYCRERANQQIAEAHDKLGRFFLQELVRPSRHTHISWAALAGAIHARQNERFQADLIDRVAEVFRHNKNPSTQSAMAISLGLLNARAKGSMLLRELQKTRDKTLQGYLCMALGMMQHKAAADLIRKITATEIVSFKLRTRAATALGLMGDKKAVDVLITALQEGQTLTVTGSAAQALGLIGDVSAIDPLLKILEDSRMNPLARAWAAVALGILGEKTDLPWNSVIAENCNYRANVEAIREVLDIL